MSLRWWKGRPAVVVIGWLSRQPSDRLEWRDGIWWEVRLAARRDPDPGLTELLVPVDEPRAAAAEAMAPAPRPDGARFASLRPAVEWLAHTLRGAEEGRLAVVDRWSDVTSMLAYGEVPPLALDQLSTVRRPLQPAPVDLSPGIAVVTWRLG